jgi:hypothetical protein
MRGRTQKLGRAQRDAVCCKVAVVAAVRPLRPCDCQNKGPWVDPALLRAQTAPATGAAPGGMALSESGMHRRGPSNGVLLQTAGR